MKRGVVFLAFVVAMMFAMTATAGAATIKAITPIDAYSTKIVIGTTAEYLSGTATVRIKDTVTGATRKTSAATIKREYTKTWDASGEEPGYVYNWGDYYCIVKSDSATIAAWRAGTYRAYLSFWEGSTKVTDLAAAISDDFGVVFDPRPGYGWLPSDHDAEAGWITAAAPLAAVTNYGQGSGAGRILRVSVSWPSIGGPDYWVWIPEGMQTAPDSVPLDMVAPGTTKAWYYIFSMDYQPGETYTITYSLEPHDSNPSNDVAVLTF